MPRLFRRYCINSCYIHFFSSFISMELTQIDHDRQKATALETDDTKKIQNAQTDFAYSEAPLKRSLAQRHLVSLTPNFQKLLTHINFHKIAVDDGDWWSDWSWLLCGHGNWSFNCRTRRASLVFCYSRYPALDRHAMPWRVRRFHISIW